MSSPRLPVRAVTLLAGEEPYWLKESWRRLRVELLGAQAQDATAAWNEQTFSATECDPVQVLEAVQVLPFLGGRRLVRVDGVDQWPAAQQDILANGLRRVGPPNYLVMVAAKMSALTRTLRQAVEQVGQVIPVTQPKAEGLVSWLQQRAQEAGGTLPAGAAQQLVEAIGPYPQTLATELDKLLVFASGRPIRQSDVQQLLSLSWAHVSDYRIFDLGDALGRRQPGQALAALQDLLESGRPPLAILATLAWHWRRLLAVAQARAQGESPAAIAKRLQLRRFALQKLWEQSRDLTPQQAAAGLTRLAEAEADIKLGRKDAADALVRLCIRLTRLGPASPHDTRPKSAQPQQKKPGQH